MTHDQILVFSTAPDTKTARSLANLLLEHKLAACVNMVPNISSVYRWEETIENSSEVLMLIKTSKSLLSKLEKFLNEQHPYQIPELISIAIEDGSAPYLEWINKSLR